MAKLIWLLGVMLFALSNNVNPFYMEQIPFTSNSYYTSSLGMVDPAQVYASYFNAGSDIPNCNTKNKLIWNNYKYRSADSSKYELNLSSADIKQANLYYFFLLDGEKDSDRFAKLTKKHDLKEGEKALLIAPELCELLTSPQSSNCSTKMELKVTGSPNHKQLNAKDDTTKLRDFRIVIEGMTCWYCCMDHEPTTQAGGYQHKGVQNVKDYPKIEAGGILGYANNNTRITIYNEEGKSITFAEYFGINDNIAAGDTKKSIACMQSTKYIEAVEKDKATKAAKEAETTTKAP